MLETAENILSAKKNYTDYINICVTFLISTEKIFLRLKTHKVKSYAIYYLKA